MEQTLQLGEQTVNKQIISIKARSRRGKEAPRARKGALIYPLTCAGDAEESAQRSGGYEMRSDFRMNGRVEERLEAGTAGRQEPCKNAVR